MNNMANFHAMTRTVNGKAYRLYAYVAAPSQIVIEPTFSKYSSASNYNDATIRNPYQWGGRTVYGTNASFYYPGARTVTAYHLYDSAGMVQKGDISIGGATNYNDDINKTGELDVMYYVSGSAAKVDYKKGTRAQIPATVKWAIGGVNVFQSQATVNAYNAGSPYGEDARTGIGKRSNGEIVFLAAYDSNGAKTKGPTMYEMRGILEFCGCIDGLCLDGSYSTIVSFKNNGANTGYGIKEGSDYRAVPTCIRLSADAVNGMTSADWLIE
jgi:exopolysaccharide biosynthesis protein